MSTQDAHRRVARQRDALLRELESMVVMCGLGWNKGDAYAEISIEHVRKAERMCKRIRADIILKGLR